MTIPEQPGHGPLPRAMEVEELTHRIRTLITIEPDRLPLVSCYLACDASAEVARHTFERRARELRELRAAGDRDTLDEALDQIRAYLTTSLHPSTRGVALFARGGEQPVFQAMQFQVPVPNHVSVGDTADIYHLVELKDTYHRYVVLISSERYARIIEVNLGAVTRELWAKRPELRERVGREWTHAHYQNHSRDRGLRFLDEKIQLLEKLMVGGGHTHLILAGNAKLTAQIRERLPPHLRTKMIDTLQFSALASSKDVVDMTLWSFIEAEQRESHNAVTELLHALSRQGLAVRGTQESLEALQRGQADVLVLSSPYQSEPVWRCRQCTWLETRFDRPALCEMCASTNLVLEHSKQLLVRLAEERGVEIELVHDSDELMRIGGVGCLLRYASNWAWRPADDAPLAPSARDQAIQVRPEQNL
ncbi:MAG: hypothetical protein H7138_15470 [Myxococcales bacterium]|nr:hypothetical protein [Myxococcales bacterium]